MKKWIKIVAGLIAVIAVLIIVAVILLVTLVKPNQFKPLIAEEIRKHTGITLNIDGDLSWSFYPYLGIKVGHIAFNNPPGFQQKIFVELNSAAVGVRLLPLLHQRIESDGLSLNGLKINLIKNAAGLSNWQHLQHAQISPASNTMPIQSQTTKAALGIAIGSVDLVNASIYWVDEQKKQQITIDQINVQAKNITPDHPFPVKAQFHFVSAGSVLSGEVQIVTDVSFQLDKQFYQLKNTALSAKVHRKDKDFNLQTQMNILVDMVLQRIECQNWQGEIADLKWTGKLELKQLATQPVITGHIQTQPFVLQKLLVALNQDAANMPAAKNMKADFNFSFDTAKQSVSSLQHLTVYGLIKSDDLQLQKIKATDLVIQAKLADGILDLAPISALFYQGNLQGNAKVNLNTTVPKITLNTKLTNIQVEPLLTDLMGNQALKFSGVGDIALQLTSAGVENHALFNNLSGAGQFKLRGGVLEGVDISYWVQSAYAIAKQKPLPNLDVHKTPFGLLSGTATIQGGVITNNDFFLDSPRYDTKGKGTIDLNSQKIDFLLETTAKQSAQDEKKELANLYKLTIPIRITGQLNHPQINLDAGELTRQVAKQQIDKVKEDVSKKIQKQIDKSLPGVGSELLKGVLGN